MQPGNFEDVSKLCSDAVPEGLRLEFKQKVDPSTPSLNNDDKRAIAKTICAFANSGGGVLYFGIATRRAGDLDVADRVCAIRNPEQCRRDVELVCHSHIAPLVKGIEIVSFDDGSGKGVIVCKVPTSEDRPHMSTAPKSHTYFARSFDGSVPMTPFQIREQMLAAKQATLDLVIRPLSSGGVTNHGSHVSLNVAFVFLLQNSGTVPCRNPFLRVRSDTDFISHDDLFDGELGGFKTEFPYGTIIHIGETVRAIRLKCSAIVDLYELQRLFAIDSTELHTAVKVLPYSDPTGLITISDKTSLDEVKFEAQYGGENATYKVEVIRLSQPDVARVVLIDPSLITHSLGPFRSDLVGKFHSSSKVLTPKNVREFEWEKAERS